MLIKRTKVSLAQAETVSVLEESLDVFEDPLATLRALIVKSVRREGGDVLEFVSGVRNISVQRAGST
jgi:hypothetical protein